jgi:hypothetical protein
MLNHVSTLIYDFKFIKIIIILSLHAHKNIQKSYFSYFSSFQNFRLLQLVLPIVLEEKKDYRVEELDPPIPELQQDFHDTNLLPFPRRNQKAKTDEQFSKFVEVIQKLYINIPLLDAIQVPNYAKYLRDILNNKRPLPSTKVIKLTEECSAAILNISLAKKMDPRCPTIDCSIGD